MIEPYVGIVGEERLSAPFFEKVRKIARRKVDVVGNVLQRKRILIVVFDIVANAPYAAVVLFFRQNDAVFGGKI